MGRMQGQLAKARRLLAGGSKNESDAEGLSPRERWKEQRRELVRKSSGFSGDSLVTVVVPVKNEERYLRSCLDSIREQDLRAWECIVVDDGSTDESLQIAQHYSEIDSRFSVVSHPESLGLGAARNTGVALTDAPYVVFLDSDDFLYFESLSSRLNMLLTAKDDDSVAGVYCDWRATRQEQGRMLQESERPNKRRPYATFVDGPACPFIATAPMLRREVIEQMGGFNEDLRSAEDFDMWVRIMRSGFVFRYVPKIGVAYRQKASGMIMADTAEHARSYDAIVDWQYLNLEDEAWFFPGSIARYQASAARTERLLQGLGVAIAAENDTGIDSVLRLIEQTDDQIRRCGINIEARIESGIVRASKAMPAYREPTVRQDALQRAVERFSGRPAPSPRSSDHPEGVGRVGPLSDATTKRAIVPAPRKPARPGIAAGSDAPAPGILHLPMARYHALEMRALAERLDAAGMTSNFLIESEFRGAFDDVLADRSRLEFERGDALPNGVSGIYCMNDWGYSRELIQQARQRSIPTFARVEGVQDFRDLDTRLIRLPYLAADHVFAQGSNDVAALDRPNVHVVGNGRLETLRGKPARTSTGDGTVVINSNFTYGVLINERRYFLQTAVHAVRKAGLVPVISQHPADQPIDDVGLASFVSTSPMSELVLSCDVLISRFSTVPFEAMAVGTPFIYFQPRSETVPTFLEPNGAYPICRTRAELLSALRSLPEPGEVYRDISDAFFRSQIDIEPGKHSDQRVTELILEIVGSHAG